MPKVKIRDLGKFGIVKDIAETELPPEAWSHGKNVAFIDGYVTRALGETDVEGTPTVVPNYLFPAPTPDVAYWAYTDRAKVYSVAGGVHTDITRTAGGDYTGAIDDKWSGGWLNGVLVLNNYGKDAPQQWLPIAPATKLTALANFSMGGVTTLRARVIRPFRSFLIGLGMIKDSVLYPTLLQWSHPADPGAVPASWDPADPTYITGDSAGGPLGNSPGALVDCSPLGSVNMVYKEDAIVRMERTSGDEIFDFVGISDRTGLMAIDCVQPYVPGAQVFLTNDATAAVTDGRTITEVSDKIVRRYLQATIDSVNRRRSFVFVDYAKKQVNFCYPTQGKSYCNERAIWNFMDNTWSFEELSDTLSIKTGFYDQSQNLRRWSDMTSTPWSSMNEPWDVRAYAIGVYKPLGAFLSANTLREVNRGYMNGSNVYESYVERRGLALIGHARDGSMRADLSSTKLVKRITPLVRSQIPVDIGVETGIQAYPDGPIAWGPKLNFNTATSQFVEPLVSGRLVALRFSSQAQSEWKLYGYDMEIEVLGRF